ncbi:MAG: DUF4867 family protein [Synergistaceae bacterium]|jgi:hypothetical protein|nr:DUF4867 family protein [Synergistaceae bacterium]
MKLNRVADETFARYGFLLEGYDLSEILSVLRKDTAMPKDGIVYVPSDAKLESLGVSVQIGNIAFGGMPIQVGYTAGSNDTLNCLEYHRGSEICIAADDVILLLAPIQKVRSRHIDTSNVDAFLMPAETAVLLYETTLHYAPCNAIGGDGYRVAVALPYGTNMDKPVFELGTDEDKILRLKNKWLLAHPDSPEAKQGAYVGLSGDNIKVLPGLFDANKVIASQHS